MTPRRSITLTRDPALLAFLRASPKSLLADMLIELARSSYGEDGDGLSLVYAIVTATRPGVDPAQESDDLSRAIEAAQRATADAKKPAP